MFFRDLESSQEVLLTHGDSISKVADNFKPTAYSNSIIVGQYIL